MSTKEADEEILLYTPETVVTTVDEATLNNITAQISQTNKWKHSRKVFCLYDNKIVGINDFNGKSTKKFWINLIHLDPNPSREKYTSWKSHLTALLLLAIGVLLITHKNFNILAEISFAYQASMAVIFVTLAVILSLIATYRSTNELTFFTVHGQVPVFKMFYKMPNKKAYQSFLEHMIQAIKTAKTNDFYNQSEQLAVELGEHRRLKNEGILSPELYNKAKNNIMQCH